MNPVDNLPREIVYNIFSNLSSPIDLSVCAQVSNTWNEYARYNIFWTKIFSGLTLPEGFELKDLDGFHVRSIIRNLGVASDSCKDFVNTGPFNRNATFVCLFSKETLIQPLKVDIGLFTKCIFGSDIDFTKDKENCRKELYIYTGSLNADWNGSPMLANIMVGNISSSRLPFLQRSPFPKLNFLSVMDFSIQCPAPVKFHKTLGEFCFKIIDLEQIGKDRLKRDRQNYSNKLANQARIIWSIASLIFLKVFVG
jgi:hypothetical protein